MGVEIVGEGNFHLHYLDLRNKDDKIGNNEIVDEGVQFLHNFQHLRSLNLRRNKITGKGVEILSQGEFPFL